MIQLAFFDTKMYDRLWFDKLKGEAGVEFKYFENKLNKDTASLAKGMRGVVAFVNDDLSAETIELLAEYGVELIAMRCAGYNNVSLPTAEACGITVVRVPEYSPYAVAEHTMALLLTLNRKTHRAYIRTRDHNFSIQGLTGFDLHNKTAGIIGTGKIGRTFIDICRGFGMNVIAYDPFEVEGITYVSLEELCKKADIISLHCPLTPETHHIINESTLSLMKHNAILLNTSRGALIDSEALLDAIKLKKIGGTGLDVYEEESDFFFNDYSGEIVRDDVLVGLISLPNVIVTSHQAFLTDEALHKIASVTLDNIRSFFGLGN